MEFELKILIEIFVNGIRNLREIITLIITHRIAVRTRGLEIKIFWTWKFKITRIWLA